MSGTPTIDDAGSATGIVISASDGKVGVALPSFSINVHEPGSGPSTSGGESPQISGNPASVAAVNELYYFKPIAQDPEGDPLDFEISNKPSWLGFDELSGTISGIPSSANLGSYPNIYITVSDRVSTQTLGPFAIEVVPMGVHSITLSWLPPTDNEDGSPLLDLAGFRIRYGQEQGSYPNLVDISNPGIATYGIDGLVANTYYFVVSAYNLAGVESNFSNAAALTLN